MITTAHFWRTSLAASLLAASSVAGAQPATSTPPLAGAISGKVTSGRQEPVAGASVMVEGTSLGALTRSDGTYRIAAVPAGPHTIVVRRVGYGSERRTVAIVEDQELTVDLQLTATATSLESVVTTATGQQRRTELGNTCARIDVDSRLRSGAIKSLAELLSAQTGGLQVQTSNTTGATSRVRMRGLNSLQVSNEPIYIIDGVRMTTTVGGAGSGSGILGANSGSTVPSRLNDITPDEIASIEVVKGPSAATLYGTDAANGVILLTTKRGGVGPSRWHMWGERGVLDDRNKYLAQYGLLGKSPGSTTQRRCVTFEVAAAQCVVDSAVSLNIWTNPDLTPLEDGERSVGGMSVSGGSTALRYYLDAVVQREDGPFGLPRFDERHFASTAVRITPEMRRPSHLEQQSYRANFNMAVSPKLDVAISSGLVLSETRFPQMDNNTDGFVYNAVAGPGYFAGPGYTGVGRIGEQLFGYATMTPGSSFQKLSQQSVNRFIGSSTANWRPIAWLRATADVGIDLTDRKDYILQRVGEGPTSGTSREGSAVDSRTRIANLTTNVLASATWAARSWAHLRSTVGVQYVGFDLNQTTATGTQLAPGGEAPSQGTVFRLATSSSPSKTLGGYVEEQAAFRDRLFVTAAVRTDRNSAVGVKYGSAYYPKASASWIASDQGLTALPYLTRLRLRAAVGSSGVQPAPTAALRTYTAASVYFGGAATPGLTQSSPGNVNLKPERSTEFETGFDSQWWRDRISAEVTYYHKQTTDALIGTQLPPSVGVGSYFVNLGGVRNEGFEYRLQSQLVDRQSVGWDVTLTGSTNHNMVTAMGDVGPGPFVANRVGKPMWTQFGRRIKYNDANADGLLSLTELTLSDTSDLQYFGSRNAPTQQSLSTGVELLRRRLRITALLDRKSGGRDLNLERQRPCELYDSCFELHRLDASLRDQARAIAVRQYGAQGGYIEATDFTKLREVAATYDLGEALSRRIAAQNARVTLAARNIKTWTKWSGADPEAFTSNNSDSFVNYQNVFTVGAPLYYMLRLDLTF